jgi:glycosyltransferase involved in cell wall biosynthesis
MAPRHDVAIYAPPAASYYDAAITADSGGAERQTVLLARALARRGLRVAHVVNTIAEPAIDADAEITLVQRSPPPNLVAKAGEVWRALSAADAQVQVFRGADGTLGVGRAWARAKGRRLVFAGANNADFELTGFAGRLDPRRQLFVAGLRGTDAVVVQSDEQAELVRARFPRLSPTQINSFVEPAPETDGGGEAFLWVSRLVSYKRPLLYTDLAAAVPEARFWMIPVETLGAEYATTLAEVRRRAAELPNLELLPPRPHAELQATISRAVAMVNTSSYEGMPNTWLEGWTRGVPALTLSFDPDRRIAVHDLGVAAGGDWDAFVAGTRRLWAARTTRDGYGAKVRAYVRDAHGEAVGDAWAELLLRTARSGRRPR